MDTVPLDQHVQTPSIYPQSPPYNVAPNAPNAPTAQEVLHHIVYTSLPPVGPHPMTIECPSCRQVINTRLIYETSTKTHLMATLLSVIGCCLCAWGPYTMDSCKNANHYCPNCSGYIGTYRS